MTALSNSRSVDDVLITERLKHRTGRKPNLIAEQKAFISLVRELSESPVHLLQRLCRVALELCDAGTTGISLLEGDEGDRQFTWIAMAGEYERYVGNTTPRDFSPCGTCLDRNQAQLYYHPERFFTYFADVKPPIVEGLVIPFGGGEGEGETGTIWIVSHDEAARKFDAEDLRVMQSLADFASVGLHQARLHDSVRRSEDRYVGLINGLGLAVYTTDAEGRIDVFNEEAVKLWGRAPEVGRDLWCGSWKIYSAAGAPLPLDECPMAVALRENRPVRGIEIQIERPDGTRAQVLPYPTPLQDEDGRILGAVNVLADITVLKRAEEEAQQYSAMRDHFLDLVSHELKSPIASILGGGLLLLKHRDKLTEEDQHRAVQDIVASAERLNEDIEHVLLLTGIDPERLNLEPVSLANLTSAAVDTFLRRHPERTVNVSVRGMLPPVLAQDTLISLVLQNILSNAHKYSAPEEQIDVSLQMTPERHVEVRIRDRGIGLSDVDMARLFTPFYRAGRAQDKVTGMGVGLAVCKEVVEAQGGCIGAEAAEGRGSEFYFRLPVAGEVG